MNLFSLLNRRETPIIIGIIGAGKFATMLYGCECDNDFLLIRKIMLFFYLIFYEIFNKSAITTSYEKLLAKFTNYDMFIF